MEIFSYIVNGWSPIISLVPDSARIVMKVVGWTGGTGGSVPASNVYIGATGYVSDIADAVDVRGSAGAPGAGVAIGGTANQALTKINSTDYNTQWTTIDKTFVGLGNVDNTSDVNKPVSTAQQTALNLKANIASPTFTGTVGGITAAMVGLGNVPNIDTTNADNISSGTLANERYVYVKAIFGGSYQATNTLNASTTQYLSPIGSGNTWNAESIRSFVVPTDGVIKNLYVVTTTTQSGTGNLVITLRKNSINQSVTVTIPAGNAAATFSDLSNSFSVAAGDIITIQGANAATATSANVGSISFIITNV